MMPESSTSNHNNQLPFTNTGKSQPSSSSSSLDEKCIKSPVVNVASSPVASRCTSLDGNSTIATYAEIVNEFRDLTRKLGASVLISVFIASIITAFLSLANDVVHLKGNLEFEIAMFLCILAASCHISDVVVSGRACILAYQHSRLPSIDRPTVEEYKKQLDAFNRCVRVSQWVQGLGQALFGIAILYTLWQMFKNRVLISSIYAFASVLQVVVYAVGFWRISWAENMILPIGRWILQRVGRGARHGV